MLSKELSQLDTADEKLEKMLEGGIDTDSSSFTGDGGMMGSTGGVGGGGQWNPSASMTGAGGDGFEMQVSLKNTKCLRFENFQNVVFKDHQPIKNQLL